MSHSPRHAQSGLTLVELLVSVTLGLVVIAALVGVFVANNRNYRQNEALALLQDNARFALDVVSRDVAMAGYWGGVRAVDAGVSVRVSATAQAAVADDCAPAVPPPGTVNWLFNVGTPLEFHNHTGAGPVDAAFGCLDPADLVADSDVLMIRHVAGQCAWDDAGCEPDGTRGALEVGRFYVKTNQNIASLFRATGSNFDPDRALPSDCPDDTGSNAPCPPVDTPQQVYAYTPQLYYVRNFLRERGDGLPVLCRRFLDDTLAVPVMDEDCLAEGVENMQIEWGVGGGADSDAVLRYTSAPTLQEITDARTLRLHFLVRANALNVQASRDAKTYDLADLTGFTPATGVLRKAFTTTVQLKNLQP